MDLLRTEIQQTVGERLERGARLLAIIGERREATGDSQLGAGVERFIIDRELRELEPDTPDVPEQRVTKVSRSAVVPVRRIVKP
jgi:hypothetical protein